MSAMPALTAVTLPLLTVTTDASVLDQSTVLLAASSGATVAIRVSLPPLASVSAVLLSDTPVTGVVVGGSGGLGSVESSNHLA